MSRETCRIHHTPFSWSLAGIPFCPTCRKKDHGEVDQLVHEGKLISTRAGMVLLESAADAESLKRS